MSQISRRTILKAFVAIPAMQALAIDHGMYLALSSEMFGNTVLWPEFAQLAAKAGFAGVEMLREPSWQAAGADTTARLLSQLQLRPAAMGLNVGYRNEEAAFKEGFAKLGERARFAQAIGCRQMAAPLPPSVDAPAAQVVVTYRNRLRACAQILADHNIRLGLEFLGPLHMRRQRPYEFIWRMPDALAFAKECGPNVGLLIDSWHWHHAGGTTADIMTAGRDRIVHVHLADAPNLPPDQIVDGQRLLPGEGVVDLAGFLQALKTIGYRDALSVEVLGRFDNQPPDDAARQAFASSRLVIAMAGVP